VGKKNLGKRKDSSVKIRKLNSNNRDVDRDSNESDIDGSLFISESIFDPLKYYP